MNTVRVIPDAAKILKKYGYYHITEDFLSALIHYVNLMDQTGMFTEEEYRSMSAMSFRERVMRKHSSAFCCTVSVSSAISS